jgi:divalent metal cation (Fe/Co/Zn/Cd) transporter
MVAARLARRTVDALVDAAPEGAESTIAQAISSVAEVVRHDRIRVRQSGNQLFVDLQLTLAGNIPLEHAEAVIALVEGRVRDVFPTADVVIYAAPQPPLSGDVVEKIRSIARRGNFLVHDVTAYEVGGRLNVNLDLEVDPALTLEKAHEKATTLEEQIKKELNEVDDVSVHLEPLLKSVEAGDEAPIDLSNMQIELQKIARKTPGLLDCHSVKAHQVSESILVRLHCTLEPALPISRVHDITEDLKFRLREAFPRISKISIHAEPEGRS